MAKLPKIQTPKKPLDKFAEQNFLECPCCGLVASVGIKHRCLKNNTHLSKNGECDNLLMDTWKKFPVRLLK